MPASPRKPVFHNPPAMSLGPVTVLFGQKNGKYPDGNQVVVRGSDSVAIFDPPLSSVERTTLHAEADLVILGHVHEDHTCALHRMPDTPLFAPQADVAAVQSWDGLFDHFGYSAETRQRMEPYLEEHFHFEPRPAAQGYADGAVWDLGGVRVRALHFPGHTAGHSVLLVEPQGIAFIGDMDLSSFGPYYGDATSNLRQFQDSLARLPDLPAKAWITSHHKGVISNREDFLRLLGAYANRLAQREAAILAHLTAQPSTLEALVAHRFLFPRGYEGLSTDDSERITTRQHLELLLEQGRIREHDGVYEAHPGAARP